MLTNSLHKQNSLKDFSKPTSNPHWQMGRRLLSAMMTQSPCSEPDLTSQAEETVSFHMNVEQTLWQLCVAVSTGYQLHPVHYKQFYPVVFWFSITIALNGIVKWSLFFALLILVPFIPLKSLVPSGGCFWPKSIWCLVLAAFSPSRFLWCDMHGSIAIFFFTLKFPNS